MHDTIKQRYYRATVTVTKTYEVLVPASNEDMAKSIAVEQVPTAHDSAVATDILCRRVELEFEAPVAPGVRVRHVTFGDGIVLSVSPTQSIRGPGASAKIEFSGGNIRDIAVSHLPPDRFLILGTA